MRALAVVVPIALLVLLAVPPAAAKPAPHQPDAADAAKAAKPAKAKAKPAEPTVAVLPFVVAKDRLTMYGKPVADAVARKLSALSGHHAEALSLSGEVPDAVWLVVDGRIIAASDGTIRLEARLRDPRRGTAQPAVATAALPLADIDALAENLATKLAAGVVRPPPRRTGPKTAPATEPTPARGPSARPPRHVDRAPRAVVFVPAAPTLAAAALTRNLVALA
ncbi:MAG TPA: hypothetical protein VFG83_17000, partial [Kofleriaceae bacterium]|nr:hypothetical protein [Kofleriaceae bacterium]